MNAKTDRPVVLIVGMLDSPHLARWLKTLRTLQADFVLFPSAANRTIHPTIAELIEHSETAKFRTTGPEARLGLVLWALDLVMRGRVRRSLLKLRLTATSIDVIHALELQHAGYLVADVLRHHQGERPKVVLSNYGSDLFWFTRFPPHQKRLEELLAIADIYSAECSRDIDLARQFGFTGTTLHVLPTAGGLEIASTTGERVQSPAAVRTMVLIKGYTNFVGRAQDILREISKRADAFENWEIVVYSSTLHARMLCWRMRRRHRNLNIRAIKKKALSHTEMMQLFSKAAAYLGFSRSDGISTSFLEALSTGAYPLQTSTACVDEWREKGAVFHSLDVDSPGDAVESLLAVLDDDDLRERAMRSNFDVARQHLNIDEIAEAVREDYRSVLGF